MSVKLGFSIPINTIDEGVGIFHYGTIIINGNAKIGKRCHIHCHTNFADGVIIGNDVYIGPGVKILNNVKIADGIRIGANSVVNKNFLEPNITIAGVPAKKVSDKGMIKKE
ncbi:serine O-acetyltransferase [Clostridium perfringens]|uniref:serine O-acetyltransferase n=1 Tax=Clostridium perfringens TaxID=1502 RepID=UPI0024BC76D2|nr:serine O-acetyltransferase [Clostridium perfringens]MDK0822926.1 serine O-acetyltransferase [Clostridium perfringens]